MIGLGVSSFSHFKGVHFQNAHHFEEYLRFLDNDQLPIYRALPLTDKQRLIREMILQMKTGALDLGYFQHKFGIDIWKKFESVYQWLQQQNLLEYHRDSIKLTREGLLQVDHFLSEFFEPELKAVRYT